MRAASICRSVAPHESISRVPLRHACSVGNTRQRAVRTRPDVERADRADQRAVRIHHVDPDFRTNNKGHDAEAIGDERRRAANPALARSRAREFSRRQIARGERRRETASCRAASHPALRHDGASCSFGRRTSKAWHDLGRGCARIARLHARHAYKSRKRPADRFSARHVSHPMAWSAGRSLHPIAGSMTHLA